MSTEECKLCNQECTPWVHINGHICVDCYGNTKRLFTKTDKLSWISVEDKLPEINETVIFFANTNKFDFYCIGYIIPECNRGKNLSGEDYLWFVELSENTAFTKNEVTHWMPLLGSPEQKMKLQENYK